MAQQPKCRIELIWTVRRDTKTTHAESAAAAARQPQPSANPPVCRPLAPAGAPWGCSSSFLAPGAPGEASREVARLYSSSMILQPPLALLAAWSAAGPVPVLAEAAQVALERTPRAPDRRAVRSMATRSLRFQVGHRMGSDRFTGWPLNCLWKRRWRDELQQGSGWKEGMLKGI
jgi:hypothetical protein